MGTDANKPMWMVRAGSAEVFDDFETRGYVGIDFNIDQDLSAHADRASLQRAMEAKFPQFATGNPFGQISRFCIDMEPGERVITYDKGSRRYLVGEVTGGFVFQREFRRKATRPVKWLGAVSRDSLSAEARNSLGSLMTVFSVSPSIAMEFEQLLLGESVPEPEDSDEGGDSAAVRAVGVDGRQQIAEQAQELVKDVVVSLRWEQMQELVAGILRAMGYKTRVSPTGSDRGKDIVASPDGLGLQDPRIVVEVKHRAGAMGAPDLRSFIAGLRPADRGLYVSTGGFTKEAHYEAARSNVAMTLLDLDDLVELLIEHYDRVDQKTTALVPLTPIYWPVGRDR